MKKFFLENGRYSMMRLLSFISVITAVTVSVFAGVSAIAGLSNAAHDLTMLAGTLLGFGLGGKVLQKFAE